MSEKLEKNELFLKGVIPPKRTTPDAIDKAIRNLREFLQRFPFRAEEVMWKISGVSILFGTYNQSAKLSAY